MARRLAPAALQRAQDTGVLIRRLTIVSSHGPPELMVWLRRVHQLKTSGRSLGRGRPRPWSEVRPHPWSEIHPHHGRGAECTSGGVVAFIKQNVGGTSPFMVPQFWGV